MAQNGVSLDLDFAQEITKATALIQSTPEQLNKAAARAAKKTIQWLQTRISREIAQALGVPQRLIKKRLTASAAGKGVNQVHILWLGVAPISAELLGRPKQTRAGVTVGRRRFQGAFYRDVWGDGERVWIRKRRAEALGMDLSNKGAGSAGASDSGRFPVVRVSVAVDVAAGEIFRRYQRRASERFGVLLEQELNYTINHEGAKR